MKGNERRKIVWRVVIFSILVNLVAWIAPRLGGGPSSPGLGFILWGTVPLFVSLLMRIVTRDWSDFGIKPAITKNLQWYMISFLAIPLLMLFALLLGTLFSISSISEFSLGQFLLTVLTAFPIFFIFAIFEEVGWRGYLAPKLASLGINGYMAAVLVGVVWASWHLPYIRELTWVYSSEDLLSFIPRFYLVCIALSMLFGEIRNITDTFWPAVIMHAVMNSFGHPLSAEYVRYATGIEYLGSISNGFIFIALALLLGIAISKWFLNESTLAKSSLSER